MPLDIGLIGATKVAERSMINPSRQLDDTAIRAVAASDPDRAVAFAERHEIPVVHPHYQAVIDDPTINTVYVSLHNSAHHEWAVRAARAGKHVIVEKPLCLDEAEFAAIENAASVTGVRFVEAVPGKGHQWQVSLRKMLVDRNFGALQSAHTRIQFAMGSADGYRCRRELGGGIFLDASSYWLQAVQAVCGLADATGAAHSDFMGPNGVDSSFRSVLTWPDGCEWVLDCCFDTRHIAEHNFTFERGVARLRQFLLPIAGPAPLNVVVRQNDSTREVIGYPPVSYYELQFGRIRELLTSAADDRDEESATGERIRLMAALLRDARGRLKGATG